MTCLSCGYPKAERMVRPGKQIIQVICPRCHHTNVIQMKGRPKPNQVVSEEPVTCRS